MNLGLASDLDAYNLPLDEMAWRRELEATYKSLQKLREDNFLMSEQIYTMKDPIRRQAVTYPSERYYGQSLQYHRPHVDPPVMVDPRETETITDEYYEEIQQQNRAHAEKQHVKNIDAMRHEVKTLAARFKEAQRTIVKLKDKLAKYKTKDEEKEREMKEKIYDQYAEKVVVLENRNKDLYAENTKHLDTIQSLRRLMDAKDRESREINSELMRLRGTFEDKEAELNVHQELWKQMEDIRASKIKAETKVVELQTLLDETIEDNKSLAQKVATCDGEVQALLGQLKETENTLTLVTTQNEDIRQHNQDLRRLLESHVVSLEMGQKGSIDERLYIERELDRQAEMELEREYGAEFRERERPKGVSRRLENWMAKDARHEKSRGGRKDSRGTRTPDSESDIVETGDKADPRTDLSVDSTGGGPREYRTTAREFAPKVNSSLDSVGNFSELREYSKSAREYLREAKSREIAVIADSGLLSPDLVKNKQKPAGEVKRLKIGQGRHMKSSPLSLSVQSLELSDSSTRPVRGEIQELLEHGTPEGKLALAEKEERERQSRQRYAETLRKQNKELEREIQMCEDQLCTLEAPLEGPFEVKESYERGRTKKGVESPKNVRFSGDDDQSSRTKSRSKSPKSKRSASPGKRKEKTTGASSTEGEGRSASSLKLRKSGTYKK